MFHHINCHQIHNVITSQNVITHYSMEKVSFYYILGRLLYYQFSLNFCMTLSAVIMSVSTIRCILKGTLFFGFISEVRSSYRQTEFSVLICDFCLWMCDFSARECVMNQLCFKQQPAGGSVCTMKTGPLTTGPVLLPGLPSALHFVPFMHFYLSDHLLFISAIYIHNLLIIISVRAASTALFTYRSSVELKLSLTYFSFCEHQRNKVQANF